MEMLLHNIKGKNTSSFTHTSMIVYVMVNTFGLNADTMSKNSMKLITLVPLVINTSQILSLKGFS